MSKTNDLILPLKKRWFDMIASGEKKEEFSQFTSERGEGGFGTQREE